jgi:hypothetical protein
MRKRAPWLNTTLGQGAWAASRSKASDLQAPCHRRRPRRGAKQAIGALAAAILTIVSPMLISGEPDRDRGPDHCDRSAKARQTSRRLAPLQTRGYAVHSTPLTA